MSLNGITGAGAVCCSYAPEGSGGKGGGGGVRIGNGSSGAQRLTGGLLQRVGKALDQAIHGGDAGQARQLIDSAARRYLGGANVVPFPLVNPFKPVLQARVPVSGLNRFPNRFTYRVKDTGAEPDDEQSSFSGFGDVGQNPGVGLGSALDELGPPPPVPIYVPHTSGSTLQSILGTIQATLPATIQAARARPSNIYPSTYNPYQVSGSQYPGDPGTGRAAEDIGAGVGRAADTLGGTVSRFVTEHPYIVIAGGAALVLLFMNPPRRR